MLKDWKNFKDEKPEFTYKDEDVMVSNQCLFFIDGRIYVGVYVNENTMVDVDENISTKGWVDSIETGYYMLDWVSDLYQDRENDFSEGSLYSDYFDRHEIYWHNIDLLGIICSIDLLKKEEKDGRVEIAAGTVTERAEKVQTDK